MGERRGVGPCGHLSRHTSTCYHSSMSFLLVSLTTLVVVSSQQTERLSFGEPQIGELVRSPFFSDPFFRLKVDCFSPYLHGTEKRLEEHFERKNFNLKGAHMQRQIVFSRLSWSPLGIILFFFSSHSFLPSNGVRKQATCWGVPLDSTNTSSPPSTHGELGSLL
jgi:hypothetical protein